MHRTRAFAVTLLLAVLGSLSGALAATLGIAILVAIRMGPSAVLDATPILLWAGVRGAEAGLVAFPIAAWLALRRVPIGRALFLTGTGIILGAIAGEFARPLNPYSSEVPGFLIGAAVGFVAAVVVIRFARPTFQSVDQAV